MWRMWFAGVSGALVVGGLLTAVVLGAASQAAPDQQAATAAVQGAAGANENNKRGDTDVGVEKNDDRGGPVGPPPWAHAQKHHGQGVKGHLDKAWKDAWQQLTPAQRAKKMAALTKAHAEGMQKFAECVAAARGDATKRAACEKPLPPGLAKRVP